MVDIGYMTLAAQMYNEIEEKVIGGKICDTCALDYERWMYAIASDIMAVYTQGISAKIHITTKDEKKMILEVIEDLAKVGDRHARILELKFKIPDYEIVKIWRNYVRGSIAVMELECDTKLSFQDYAEIVVDADLVVNLPPDPQQQKREERDRVLEDLSAGIENIVGKLGGMKPFRVMTNASAMVAAAKAIVSVINDNDNWETKVMSSMWSSSALNEWLMTFHHVGSSSAAVADSEYTDYTTGGNAIIDETPFGDLWQKTMTALVSHAGLSYITHTNVQVAIARTYDLN